jgi:F420-0:gamma-glutamyl ligase-like protein
MYLIKRTTEIVPCEVEVSHCFDSLHAHVKFLDGTEVNPGDEVLLHGAPVMAPYGEIVREKRLATITRASLLEQLWTRFRGGMNLTELYEVSFSEKVSV